MHISRFCSLEVGHYIVARNTASCIKIPRAPLSRALGLPDFVQNNAKKDEKNLVLFCLIKSSDIILSSLFFL